LISTQRLRGSENGKGGKDVYGNGKRKQQRNRGRRTAMVTTNAVLSLSAVVVAVTIKF
jgi:hypothetical protein